MRPRADDFIEHYAHRGEKLADGLVHALGLTGAAAGGVVLIVMSMLSGGGLALATATGLYAVCLITMLACSALYNLTKPTRARPFLRRLDEAAIFIMIAGSYTPFTTQRLTGAWAIGMTTLVWALAIGGAVGKLFSTRLPDWIWTLVYVGFGWVALIALRPLIQGVPVIAIALLTAGGLIYTTGALIFHSRLPYRRAIWHGFVVTAAGVHYAAICAGVVLARPLLGQ
ncbi:MAG TPA: hemolysin III family protein [Caulobacteraceae bacterium]|nr:hemolysin III family protein [Caulobacteraceae bacterium]